MVPEAPPIWPTRSAADKCCGPRRHVGFKRADCGERREARDEIGVDELKDMLGAAEIFQAMLAEIDKSFLPPGSRSSASDAAEDESRT